MSNKYFERGEFGYLGALFSTEIADKNGFVLSELLFPFPTKKILYARS